MIGSMQLWNVCACRSMPLFGFFFDETRVRGRPVDLPPRAALLTMDDIREAATAKRVKRAAAKAASDTKRRRLREAFSSPTRMTQESEAKKARSTAERRAIVLVKVARQLADLNNYNMITAGLYGAHDAKVTLAEAKDRKYNCIGKRVWAIDSNPQILKANKDMTKLLLQAWCIEKRNERART